MLTALASNTLEPAPLAGPDLRCLAELIDTFAHALSQPLMTIQLASANLERCLQQAHIQISTETLRQAVDNTQTLYSELFMLLQACTGQKLPQATSVNLLQLKECVSEPIGLDLLTDPLNPPSCDWNLAIATSWLSTIVRNLMPLFAGTDSAAASVQLQVSSEWLTLIGVGGDLLTDHVTGQWPKHPNLTIARRFAALAELDLTLLSETTQIKAVRISPRLE